MKSNRTFNTLFMLMSVDGKICTGVGDRDIDLDSNHYVRVEVNMISLN